MIRYIGCETARELLDAFLDGELAVDTQVMVESHLRWCRTCATRVEDMALIGAAVRLGPPAVRARDDDSLTLAHIQSDVLARVRAERAQSWPVRLREMFADKRLLWPALGATMAVLFCVSGFFGVMQLATAERPDSLAGMIQSIANPGSDTNPLRLADAMSAPRVVSDPIALDQIPNEDAVFAVATVVTREGRVANYELLLPQQVTVRNGRAATHDEEDVAALLHAVKQSRFAPAQSVSGEAVAVNMVWLFARTTAVLERDVQLEELLHAAPRVRRIERVPAPEVPKPVAEPSGERSALATASTTA